MFDTFLTTSYKGYYIKSKRDIATGKEIVEISTPEYTTIPVKSRHAAKCIITRRIKDNGKI